MLTQNFEFPVMCFSKGFILIKRNQEELAKTSSVALKNGIFNGLLIVDSQGKAIKVKSAKRVHGIGLFWGFSLFYGQKIKVSFEYDGEPFQMSLDDIKKEVFDSFKKFHGWRSQPNYQELRKSVEQAKRVSEIVKLISD